MIIDWLLFLKGNTRIIYSFYRDDPVVIGICLPVGLPLTQVHLLGVRPPDIVTPFDGWIIVNSLDELFEDDTMTSLYVDGR